jgi:transcriptional regulator with XRE-family HTH domain
MGLRVREYRLLRRLSVRALAAAAGTSPSFISQLENGKTQVSIPVLTRIAAALGVGIGDLFSDEGVSSARVLRKQDRPSAELGSGFRKTLVTRRPFQHLEGYEIELEPGACLGEDVTYGDTHALIVILEGEAHIELDGEAETLAAGDSLEFGSATPHTISNKSSGDMSALIVFSPPALGEPAEPSSNH